MARGRRAPEAKASRNAPSVQKLKTNTSRHLEANGSPKRNEIATPACHSRGIVIVAERSLAAVTGGGRCRNGRESGNHKGKRHRDLRQHGGPPLCAIDFDGRSSWTIRGKTNFRITRSDETRCFFYVPHHPF